MAAVLLSSVLLLSAFTTVLAVDNDTNHIFQPSGISNSGDWSSNQIYFVGSPYPLQWITSTSQPYTVNLWQAIAGAGYANDILTIYSTASNPSRTTISWTCDKGSADLSVSNTFYLELKSNDLSIASHAFNISNAAPGPVPQAAPFFSSSTTASPTTVTQSASTATVTMTATPMGFSTFTTSSVVVATTGSSSQSPQAAPSASTSTVASSATNAAASQSGSQASTSSPEDDAARARTTLGIGFGIGIPLVGALTIWVALLVLQRRRRSRELSEKLLSNPTPSDYTLSYSSLPPSRRQTDLEQYAGHSMPANGQSVQSNTSGWPRSQAYAPITAELPSRSNVHEAPAYREAAELPHGYCR